MNWLYKYFQYFSCTNFGINYFYLNYFKRLISLIHKNTHILYANRKNRAKRYLSDIGSRRLSLFTIQYRTRILRSNIILINFKLIDFFCVMNMKELVNLDRIFFNWYGFKELRHKYEWRIIWFTEVVISILPLHY